MPKRSASLRVISAVCRRSISDQSKTYTWVGAGISYDCSVSKRFRVCSLDQQFLLPPSLQDWLPEDHLARFVADVMNELDLSAIFAEYERSDGRGLSAYHPLLMTRVLHSCAHKSHKRDFRLRFQAGTPFMSACVSYPNFLEFLTFSPTHCPSVLLFPGQPPKNGMKKRLCTKGTASAVP
jgi:hypothetical protein